MNKEITIRILHVLNNLGNGGAESVIMNYYRYIDRTKIQFDFLVRSQNNNPILLDEIKGLGGKVYFLPEFPRHLLKNYLHLKKFLKHHRNEYHIIHIHANSLIYFTPLKLAKKYNIHCRILHSHCARASSNFATLIHKLNRQRIKSYITDKIACSTQAGIWMYGDAPFFITNNAIESEKYFFDEKIRKIYRQNFGIADSTLVIGHTGRFTKAKNHVHIINVFVEILQRRNDCLLLLAGTGELKREMETLCKKMNIDNKVRFLGAINDVSNLLNAFDVFLFPSLFEGLPCSIIEAQANGLQIVCSDKITQEALITENIYTLSLDENPAKWAETILKLPYNRQNSKRKLRDAGFDIKQESRKLENFYLQKIKDIDL